MKPQMIAAAAGLLLALTACSNSSSEDPAPMTGAADSPTASPSASVAAAPSSSPPPTPTATPTPSASSSTVEPKPKPANKSATTAAEPAPPGPVAVEANQFRLSDLPAGHYGFASPSGNIKCVATSGSVNCEMSTVQWMSDAEARKACDGVGELAGLSMIRSQRPTLRCAGDPLFESLPPTLEYGQKITVAPFTCLSQTTGMTCTDAGTGHSFSGARAGYTMR